MSIVCVRKFLFAVLFLPAVALGAAPNFLFICTDDLRPMLGCYGAEWMHTPNLDALAASGTLFERAYCQAAQCGPSRVSFMTGLRPDTTGNFTLRDRFNYADKASDDTLTFARYLRASGYTTQAFGKIFHDGRDDVESWSVPASPGRDGEILEIMGDEDEPSIVADRENCPAWQMPDVDDDALYAGRMTSRALATLAGLKQGGQPFLLGVGFRRPHLPFVAPLRYYDLYPDDSAAFLVPGNAKPASDAPLLGFYNSTNYAPPPGKKSRWPVPPVLRAESKQQALDFAGYELRSYQRVPPQGLIDEATVRQLRLSYMACVSYVDAQVGRLLKGFQQTGLDENTVVVFLSDHGWHLGEHGTWSKMTNYEWATRVPLIVRAPGRDFKTGRSKALVELVDLYPTICELADLKIPNHAEGDSLVPLLRDPEYGVWKNAAFSQFPRKLGPMGRAIRTDRYRYVEWWQADDPKDIVARELYDHERDPNELQNIAGKNDSKTAVKSLSRRLRAGWKAAR